MKQYDLGKVVKINSSLRQELMKDFIDYLQAHTDVFAWLHEDSCGLILILHVIGWCCAISYTISVNVRMYTTSNIIISIQDRLHRD